jgi:hypothetical protein
LDKLAGKTIEKRYGKMGSHLTTLPTIFLTPKKVGYFKGINSNNERIKKGALPPEF